MNYLEYLVQQIHSTVVATVDDNDLPVTAAIDMMDYDENGLYFLTAKGKGFYHRLKKRKYLALTGMKGKDTMSCVAISIRGKVHEVGEDYLPVLFEKNSYMAEIYPTNGSRKALTVFKLYQGTGEWFDLSKKPIERASFTFGNGEKESEGYFITDACVGCGSCQKVCPQNCIVEGQPFAVQQKHCLHCGNCMSICPVQAVEKRG
ncbi:MAG: 4Fe-4S binding protein [Eubacteriales bacterium]|nr:4Fe-4S binding protein [Eubacteriales bacterium]